MAAVTVASTKKTAKKTIWDNFFSKVVNEPASSIRPAQP